MPDEHFLPPELGQGLVSHEQRNCQHPELRTFKAPVSAVGGVQLNIDGPFNCAGCPSCKLKMIDSLEQGWVIVAIAEDTERN